jgi:hypothetical protein
VGRARAWEALALLGGQRGVVDREASGRGLERASAASRDDRAVAQRLEMTRETVGYQLRRWSKTNSATDAGVSSRRATGSPACSPAVAPRGHMR